MWLASDVVEDFSITESDWAMVKAYEAGPETARRTASALGLESGEAWWTNVVIGFVLRLIQEKVPVELTADGYEVTPVPPGAETYVRHSAFSREVRLIGEPVTHAEDSAETLAGNGTVVRVRPHYKVPKSRSLLSTVRSPWSYEARVVRVCGDMVHVEYTWETDTPWGRTGAFKTSELHRLHACECAACCGENGITEFGGA
ncbi:hypothetical protein ACFU99_05760 [Streptomyces sp. NPDC057654]|uniref:hypothetical protein n=1 Tax=Streptomyces sp. NPDC057654 TaxID=3346196 RepID=UPI0036BCEC24